MEQNREEAMWEDIRPYKDEEMPMVVQEMAQDQEFVSFVKNIMPDKAEQLIAIMLKADSVYKFKETVSYHIVHDILKKTTFSCDISGRSHIEKDKGYTFISNHRDIVLDSAFLNVLLFDSGYKMPRIAIGDNLFARPWVKKLVRMNDSFIVQRSLAPRELLVASKNLSHYMSYSVQEENASVWIAQREGRAKDGNDRTNAALLKMINLAGKTKGVEQLLQSRIVPVSISYEYDPCDFFKARELYIKKKEGSYPKTKEEDFLNMKEGITGYKGRVHFSIGRPLEELLKDYVLEGSVNAQLQEVAEIMDREIHKGYHLYPGNYVAEDLLTATSTYFEKGHYSLEEKAKFGAYIQGQFEKTGLGQDAQEEVKNLLYLMYAHPLRNYLQANQSK